LGTVCQVISESINAGIINLWTGQANSIFRFCICGIIRSARY